MNIIEHHIKIHSVYKYAERFYPVSDFKEAQTLILQNRIKAEIIGQWLYCFTTALIGVQLKALGFWYSYKHEAYVYTGRHKDGIADDESLDEIRARLGSRQVRS